MKKPSKLNKPSPVPVTLCTVQPARMEGLEPAATRQRTEVDDPHAAVLQLVSPMSTEGVVSREPKLIPDTVRLCPAVMPAL